MTRNEFRWRLLKQALLQKKAKAMIILLAVTMGASVVAALLNLQIDLRSRMNRELRDYGPNVVIQPLRTGEYVSAEFVSKLRTSPLLDSLIAYSPQLIVPVQIQQRTVVMTIVDLDAYRKLYPSIEWTPRKEVAASQTIFVGKRLAGKLRTDDLQNLSISIQGRPIDLPSGGELESGESEDDQVFIGLPAAAKLGLTSHGFHSVVFSALGELSQVEKSFAELVQQNPGIQYKVIRKIAAAESTILDKISRLMGLVILFIFVILFFCIHTTVSAILISRQAEIALLRVLGAKRKQITAIFTTELLLVGIVGGATGYLVGIFMAQLLGKVLFQSYIVPSFIVFVVTLVFSLLLMLISSFLPISRAVNRQAALVLKDA